MLNNTELVLSLITFLMVATYFMFTVPIKDVLTSSKSLLVTSNDKYISVLAAIIYIMGMFLGYILFYYMQTYLFPLKMSFFLNSLVSVIIFFLPFITVLCVMLIANKEIKKFKNNILFSSNNYTSNLKKSRLYMNISFGFLVVLGLLNSLNLFYFFEVNTSMVFEATAIVGQSDSASINSYVIVDSVLNKEYQKRIANEVINDNLEKKDMNVTIENKYQDEKDTGSNYYISNIFSLGIIISYFLSIYLGSIYSGGLIYTYGSLFALEKFKIKTSDGDFFGYIIGEDNNYLIIKERNKCAKFIKIDLIQYINKY